MSDKSIENYTIGEIKSHCKEAKFCECCKFKCGEKCRFGDSPPRYWNLGYSSKAIEFTNLLKELLNDRIPHIFRYNVASGELFVNSAPPNYCEYTAMVLRNTKISQTLMEELDGKYVHEIIDKGETKC